MIYDRYASVYDVSGQIRFALLFSRYLDELLKRHPVAGRRALDMACGTGTLAMNLADHGWEVVGYDASAAMLACARRKAADSDSDGQPRFLQGDMRQLGDAFAPASFDLITCTYDSLNYLLTDDDFVACIRSVADVLAPGGLFVGDMNTRHFMEHDWGTCDIQEHQGYTQICQSSFDPVASTSTMHLTGFLGDDQYGYERFDEIHIERAYDHETVTRVLEDAGLTPEACYHCFTFRPPTPTTQRLAWVGRKSDEQTPQ